MHVLHHCPYAQQAWSHCPIPQRLFQKTLQTSSFQDSDAQHRSRRDRILELFCISSSHLGSYGTKEMAKYSEIKGWNHRHLPEQERSTCRKFNKHIQRRITQYLQGKAKRRNRNLLHWATQTLIQMEQSLKERNQVELHYN